MDCPTPDDLDPTRLIRCRKCPKVFMQMRSLHRHLKTAHGPKLWSCQQCKFICGRRDNLRRHYGRIHPSNMDELAGITPQAEVASRHNQDGRQRQFTEKRWGTQASQQLQRPQAPRRGSNPPATQSQCPEVSPTLQPVVTSCPPPTSAEGNPMLANPLTSLWLPGDELLVDEMSLSPTASLNFFSEELYSEGHWMEIRPSLAIPDESPSTITSPQQSQPFPTRPPTPSHPSQQSQPQHHQHPLMRRPPHNQ